MALIFFFDLVFFTPTSILSIIQSIRLKQYTVSLHNILFVSLYNKNFMLISAVYYHRRGTYVEVIHTYCQNEQFVLICTVQLCTVPSTHCDTNTSEHDSLQALMLSLMRSFGTHCKLCTNHYPIGSSLTSHLSNLMFEK